MKAIWNHELHTIMKDDGDGVYLLPIESMSDEDIFYIDYMEPGLIIDPTDGQIEDMSVDNGYI